MGLGPSLSQTGMVTDCLLQNVSGLPSNISIRNLGGGPNESTISGLSNAYGLLPTFPNVEVILLEVLKVTKKPHELVMMLSRKRMRPRAVARRSG